MNPSPGSLFIVATPVGHLEDMTFRAVDILAGADMIAAEDTRVSRVLLARYGIKTPLVSCHKFNENNRLDFFTGALREGRNIALISDAGVPCLSDPGHRLAARAAAAGFAVVSVPGPSAVTAAVSVSGFDAAAFLFIGFLPRAKKDCAAALTPPPGRPPLLVFFESPRRIVKTLALFNEVAAGARLCLCNDLTKKYERVYRGSPAEVLVQVSENPQAEKGEYTCVAEYPAGDPQPESGGAARGGVNKPAVSLEAQLVDIMARDGVSLKEAAAALGEGRKNSRNPIYAAALRLKAMFEGTGADD